MKLFKIANSYLRQAEARLNDAKDALLEGNYPYAVRLSQECVELSLKATLKIVGIEYPKVHDVSDILLEVKERFPEWFKVELDFLCYSSKVLAKKRELSFYGGEEALLSPDEVIDKKDAEDAVSRAERTYRLCKRLSEEIKIKKD
ncbi:MAG: HEPN domain-containing protein [Nitrososphaerota archaeon]|nr:HEPN domain-containing protein [Nitrososphaerales archaeon]MDW8045093.1 HEPN domain-containing protein [Nitrososphaerota archaeon]